MTHQDAVVINLATIRDMLPDFEELHTQVLAEFTVTITKFIAASSPQLGKNMSEEDKLEIIRTCRDLFPHPNKPLLTSLGLQTTPYLQLLNTVSHVYRNASELFRDVSLASWTTDLYQVWLMSVEEAEEKLIKQLAIRLAEHAGIALPSEH